MILLDTHIWVWWAHGDPRLPEPYRSAIRDNEPHGLGVSAISCWEVAKLVEYGRLTLPLPLDDWLDCALAYPGVRLLDLTPRIAAESARLPAPFHRDPSDQILVATARVHDCPIVSVDARIRGYPHVRLAP